MDHYRTSSGRVRPNPVPSTGRSADRDLLCAIASWCLKVAASRGWRAMSCASCNERNQHPDLSLDSLATAVPNDRFAEVEYSIDLESRDDGDQ